MRRVALALMAVVILCSGQGCPVPSSSSAAGRPSSVIPAGTYAGDVTYGGNASIDGTVIADFEPLASPYSGEFGADGVPLMSSGASLDVGSRIVMSFDDNDAHMTVTAIRSIVGGLAIDYDVVMAYQVNGQSADANGSAHESFKMAAGGKLDYAFEMAVDFVMDDTPFHMVVTGSGLLSR